MMFLAEPFDLDVENQGGRVAGLLAAASEVVVRRAPLLGSFVGSVVAEWRKLIAEISNAFSVIAGIATRSKRNCSAVSIRSPRRMTTICRSRNQAFTAGHHWPSTKKSSNAQQQH